MSMPDSLAQHSPLSVRHDYGSRNLAQRWRITSDSSTFPSTSTQTQGSSSSAAAVTSNTLTSTHNPSSSSLTSTSRMASTDGSGVAASSTGAPAPSDTTNGHSGSLSFISTTITTSIPSTVTSSLTTFTTFVPTTLTTSTGILNFGTSLPDSGSISAESQPVCIGHGLDVSSVGLIATVVLPSVVGLIIWVIFAVLRTRVRQVYGVREWFPPPNLRPQPLKDTLWAFLFPNVPFVPSLPDKSDMNKTDAGEGLPSDGQLSQRVLWICLIVVLGWSFIGLAGALPLYLVNIPCLAQSVPQASFGGLYSTLQDLSLLRLLQLLEDENFSTESNLSSRAVVDGKDVSSNIRTRLVILTVFALVLGMPPALYKFMKEFTRLVNYRRHWLEVRCDGIEMGWLSAKSAPGFVGWGEKRIKDFIIKSGLTASLDRKGGIGTSGAMAGVGSGYRARTQSQQNRDRDEAERPLNDDEKSTLQVDICSLFSIGDSGELFALISERDRILERLEVSEAQYIASFRLSTPDASIAEIPVPPVPEDENSIKMQISRPKALAGSTRARRHRGRQTASSSSAAPTSYVAPSQYYKLRNVRGISDGRLPSQSGDDSSYGGGPSFGDSVRSRIVGSRFHESSRDDAGGNLPIGSRVALNQGELGPIPDYGPNHGMEPSSGNEGDTETSPLTGSVDPGTSRDVSRVDEELDYPAHVLRGIPLSHSEVNENSNLKHTRHVSSQQPTERRETFPMRSRVNGEQNEAQVPLHLRLQPQGPFVRPLSGLDHDGLGIVYSDIREWRTRLKQINNEISDAQNDCYNDIADGARIKGWLITGRGLRFLPGVELIEGRSKDDILWSELQDSGGLEKKVSFWSFVAMITILLGAGLIAVSGLAVAVAPNVAHYLPFFQSFLDDDTLGPGIATALVPAIVATLFFVGAVGAVDRASRYSGAISVSSTRLTTFKATFYILTVVGMMWFTAVGAVVFAMDAFAVGSGRPSTIADGSIYMSAFFLALVVNVAIISPGLSLLQPAALREVLLQGRRAITPRQQFRAQYPRVYNPTYATACCVLAVILASSFTLIFPLIGPAVVLLLFLTIVAHRFLVGYVYGRTDAQTGGLLQIWLLRRFAVVVTFQPILLGVIFLTRRLFIEGGILIGFGVAAIIMIEAYACWKTRLPGRKSLSTVTLNALDTFEERASARNKDVSESEGASFASAPRMRPRGSISSVLEMMSLTLAVMPTPHQAREAVPLDTESLDDLIATERAARTHPDAPPHLPPLPFADHAEEMAGILYAPELIAPSPIIWLPSDSAGIARSEAYDLQRYHNLKTTIDVRSHDDVFLRRSSSSRRRVTS
ncbi:hypothetical protein DFH11DRAFT_1559146 [Phellopilus nigrolimitatus]|nr:hypothetical protein DFH11DRAFT_1559146 [Phellopilus nigrolimitatus]